MFLVLEMRLFNNAENVSHWSSHKTCTCYEGFRDDDSTTQQQQQLNNDNINNSNIILATAVTVVDREKSSKLYILHGLFNNTVSGLDCWMKL